MLLLVAQYDITYAPDKYSRGVKMTRFRLKNHLSKLSLVMSLLVPIWFAIAANGSTWGWWSWQTGLGVESMGSDIGKNAGRVQQLITRIIE